MPGDVRGSRVNLAPCSCGQVPTMTRTFSAPVNILRIVCKCGNHGGSVFYVKPEDRARTEQATADGWALAQV